MKKNEASESKRNETDNRPPKRPYTPPAIAEEAVFARLAVGCSSTTIEACGRGVSGGS